MLLDCTNNPSPVGRFFCGDLLAYLKKLLSYLDFNLIFMTKENERLLVLLPTGEMEETVFTALSTVGITYDKINRRLFVPSTTMPIDFVLGRASDGPRRVLDNRSKSVACITRGDILWEAGHSPSTGTLIPVKELVPSSPECHIYAGITEKFAMQIAQRENRAPTLSDLDGQTIATKVQRIAREFFDERGITAVIEYAAGGIEGLQYDYDWPGVVDISCTGTSQIANKLIPLEDVLNPITTNLFSNPDKIYNGSQSQVRLFEEFRDRLANK